MKNKRRKIKWDNIALLIILIVSTIIILHDLYVLLIMPWINSNVLGWTWWGLLTFIISLCFVIEITDYFTYEINKIQE